MPLPAEIESTVAESPLVKPRLRGVSHKYAFYVSLVAGLVLVLMAGDTHTRLIALVYAFSLSSLLGVSALYHCIDWPPAKRRWMRRLDHTMILVLIAGSYTPICTLALKDEVPEVARRTLFIVWGAVVGGAILNLIWVNAPKWLTALLCVGVSFVAVDTLVDLYRVLGAVFVGMIGLGGIFYIVGAVVYTLKKPNPNPAVFGYHEIFHALVVAAAAVHFAAFSIYIFAPLT